MAKRYNTKDFQDPLGSNLFGDSDKSGFINDVTPLDDYNLNLMLEGIKQVNKSIDTNVDNKLKNGIETKYIKLIDGGYTSSPILYLDGTTPVLDMKSSDGKILTKQIKSAADGNGQLDIIGGTIVLNSLDIKGVPGTQVDFGMDSSLKVSTIKSSEIQTDSIFMSQQDSQAKVNGTVYAQSFKGYAGEAPRFNSGIEVRGEITGEPKVNVPNDSLTNKSSTAVANVKFVHDILAEFTILDGGGAAEAEAQAKLDTLLYRMDVNGDGYIDQNDLTVLGSIKDGIEAGATTIPDDGKGDLNFDGKIDNNDMWILMNYINQGVLPE